MCVRNTVIISLCGDFRGYRGFRGSKGIFVGFFVVEVFFEVFRRRLRIKG